VGECTPQLENLWVYSFIMKNTWKKQMYVSCSSVRMTEFWKCFFVTAKRSGKLQNEALEHFLDNVTKVMCEER
jgi:hypothetical protein